MLFGMPFGKGRGKRCLKKETKSKEILSIYTHATNSQKVMQISSIGFVTNLQLKFFFQDINNVLVNGNSRLTHHTVVGWYIGVSSCTSEIPSSILIKDLGALKPSSWKGSQPYFLYSAPLHFEMYYYPSGDILMHLDNKQKQSPSPHERGKPMWE